MHLNTAAVGKRALALPVNPGATARRIVTASASWSSVELALLTTVDSERWAVELEAYHHRIERERHKKREPGPGRAREPQQKRGGAPKLRLVHETESGPTTRSIAPARVAPTLRPKELQENRKFAPARQTPSCPDIRVPPSGAEKGDRAPRSEAGGDGVWRDSEPPGSSWSVVTVTILRGPRTWFP